jgi:hypothetical protein
LNEPTTHLTLDDLCQAIDPRRADYVRALESRGMTTEAFAQANCMRYGKTTEECAHGHFGRGHRTRCHDSFCTIDGRHQYRLHPWLLTRSEDVLTEAQVGIEIIVPNEALDAATEGPPALLPMLQRDYDLPASLARRRRNAVADLSTRFLHALGLGGGLAADVISPNDADTRVRLAVHTEDLRYGPALATLKSLNPLAQLNLKRNHAPREVLLWTFAGIEPALTLSGEYRVALRLAFKGAKLIRTLGAFYARLNPEQIKERKRKHAEELAQGHPCPICQEDMRVIPLEQQTLEPVAEIEDRYQHFTWTENYTPSEFVSRGGDRNKSPRGYQVAPSAPTVAASPPPG